MTVLSYAKCMNLLSALDEFTNCNYTKKELLTYIYKHYIDKGPFFVFNSFGTKAIYKYPYQKKEFIKFINLIKKQGHEEINSKGKVN